MPNLPPDRRSAERRELASPEREERAAEGARCSSGDRREPDVGAVRQNDGRRRLAAVPATGGSLMSALYAKTTGERQVARRRRSAERRELASPEREERAAEGGSLQFRRPEGA